jgi:hypothetical protein
MAGNCDISKRCGGLIRKDNSTAFQSQRRAEGTCLTGFEIGPRIVPVEHADIHLAVCSGAADLDHTSCNITSSIQNNLIKSFSVPGFLNKPLSLGNGMMTVGAVGDIFVSLANDRNRGQPGPQPDLSKHLWSVGTE